MAADESTNSDRPTVLPYRRTTPPPERLGIDGRWVLLGMVVTIFLIGLLVWALTQLG